MRTTIKVDGLRELDDALAEMSKATARNILRRAGIKALEPVAETARQLAPDDPQTGGNDLRSSIGVGTRLSPRQAREHRRQMRADGGRAFVEVFVGAGNVPHAHMQEFGTAHHAPQPFMRPAWDEHQDGVIDSLKTEIGAEIDKAAQRAARKAARLAKRAAQ